MSKRLLISAVSALLIAFGSISTVWAQGSTGMLDGQIVDASGSGLGGVSVTVSSKRTGLTRSVTTNASGHFKMQLPPGTYELNSSSPGYSSVTIEQVAVNLGVTTELTIPVQDAAIEEIRTALEAEPANGFLQDHLESQFHRRIDVLRRAAELTSEA